MKTYQFEDKKIAHIYLGVKAVSLTDAKAYLRKVKEDKNVYMSSGKLKK